MPDSNSNKFFKCFETILRSSHLMGLLVLLRNNCQLWRVIAIGGVVHWDALLSDHQRKEKYWLEESVHSLTLQRDAYL